MFCTDEENCYNKSFVLLFFEEENDRECKYKNTIVEVWDVDNKTTIKNINDLGSVLKTDTNKCALFEIVYKESNEDKTTYLYCSDIESVKKCGLFDTCNHKNNSAIDYNTTNVTNMGCMFFVVKI